MFLSHAGPPHPYSMWIVLLDDYRPIWVNGNGESHIIWDMSQQYDPFQYHRKTIRYTDWDYRTPGYYFITICTKNRYPFFDDPSFRQIMEQRLQVTPRFASHTRLDEWIVMSDHAHFNLWIVDWPQSKLEEPDKRQGSISAQPGSVGAIVGNLKSLVSREINDLRDGKGNSIWQKGYWDRIVRNDEELDRIRHYIRTNPERWNEKNDDLDALLQKMTFHP